MTAEVTPSNSTVNQVAEPAFNSLIVEMLLTAAGGFLDAFSYLGQGHVFANVMTGIWSSPRYRWFAATGRMSHDCCFRWLPTWLVRRPAGCFDRRHKNG